MFQIEFGSFQGLNDKDYLLLDALLEKDSDLKRANYQELITFRHEANEVEPLLMVFEISNAANKRFILKIKKTRIDHNDEFDLQRQAYSACWTGVIRPYKGGEFTWNHTNFQYILMDKGLPIQTIYSKNKEEILKLFIDFLKDLEKIRKRSRIAHRDIKPGNIVYDPMGRRIKLIDFDFAARRSTGESIEQTQFHSGIFSAPEMYCFRRNGQYRYGNRAMLFSVAMCIYIALNGGISPGCKTPGEENHMTKKELDYYNLHPNSKKFSAPLTHIRDERLSAILVKARSYHTRNRYKDEIAFARALETYLHGKKPLLPSTLLKICTVVCIGGMVTYFGMCGIYSLTEHPQTAIETTESESTREGSHTNNTPVSDDKEDVKTSWPEVEQYPEFTYQIPKESFKNRNGIIRITAPLDLSDMALQGLNNSDYDIYLENISDNIVSRKYTIDLSTGRLTFQSIAVKNQKPVKFRLYLKYGNTKTIVYDKIVILKFQYS